jgi:hypothetical protein
MSLTVNSWSLIAYEDDITNPIRTLTNSDTFDPAKWTTIGERYCLEINLSYSGTVNVGDNVGVSFIRSSITGAETVSTPLIDKLISGSSVTSSNLLNFFNYYEDSGNLIVQFFFLNVADYNDWFADIDALGLPDDLLDKNIINNTILFSNFLPSQYNQLKKFRIALKYDTDPIEYFNFDFAGKFYSQNFANALPDIDFVSDNLIVNGNFVNQLSTTINTTVLVNFQMLNPLTPGTPTNMNLQVVRIDTLSLNEYYIAESLHTQSFINLGNNQYQATFTVPFANIEPLKQYRLIYVVYDTVNDYFNSFPILRYADGTPPSHTGKFTHNWGTPNNVAGGLNTDKIVTSVNQRIGSSLRIDRDVYSSIGIPNISPYFESFKVSDKDGNILRQWNRNQQIPIDSVGVLFGAQNIFAFVYRVPIAWDNSVNEFKWELTYNFPFGIEIWEFTAEIEVNESDDNIVFKKPNGDALGVVCLDELPNFIIVETNDPAQANNDKQVATFEGGFEWYGVRDENSDITQVQNNSLPNTAFNWGIFAFDDPYIFDVTTSNGTVMSYKFRIKDYIDNFGINAVQNKFFGSILIK